MFFAQDRPLGVPRGSVPRRGGRLSRPAAALAALLVACGGSPAPDRPPNVVLVVVDTLRADHLSSYGYGRPTAVGLERFLARSTVFEACSSPSPWTTPSVASLLTGLFPTRHRAVRFGSVLSAPAHTLAEALAERGYHTVGQSFNLNVATARGFDQGFERFEEHDGRVLGYPDVSEMVAFVEEVLPELEAGGRPFFLYLQPMNVHGPYRVPPEHLADLLGRPPDRTFRYRSELVERVRAGDLSARDEVDARFLESLVDQYDAAIRYTTDQLARILELLAERGRLEDTLVVLTADHGEELFDHGGFSHGYSLHEEVLHVPLAIHLPGQEEPARVARPVTLLDLYPTVLELAGAPSREGLDGESLAPLLRGERMPPPAARLHHTSWEDRCDGEAIVAEGHKLVRLRSSYEGVRDSLRLYDLAADPEETRDLVEERPELAARLLAELEERLRDLERARLEDAGTNLSEEERDLLRAIGYGD